MRVLFNDNSLSGQFRSVNEFLSSFEILMSARRSLREHSSELHCCRNIFQLMVTSEKCFAQVLKRVEVNKRSALLAWLNRAAPFWEDCRVHSSDDYFEHAGMVVTDSAVAEAAFRVIKLEKCQIFSLSPSCWLKNPVEVLFRKNESDSVAVSVENHWNVESLLCSLLKTRSVSSWKDIEVEANRRCKNLFFLDDCFTHLSPHPFVKSAAESILKLLEILDRYAGSLDVQGSRTRESHEIFDCYFTGDRALFSDSSDSEKAEFESELLFRVPDQFGQYLLCSWHGKVNTPKLRVHFAFGTERLNRVFVAYVGPKITKR